MVSNISSALNAYQQALSRIGGNVPVPEPKPTINNEFQNLVKSAVDEAVDLSKTGEEMSSEAVTKYLDTFRKDVITGQKSLTDLLMERAKEIQHASR